MRRRVLAVAIVAVAVAALVCGLGGWGASRLLAKLVGPQPRYDLAALQRQPEAGLVAPGSYELRGNSTQRGGGAIMLAGGPHPARQGTQFGSGSQPQEVTAFYQRELQGRGWQPYQGANDAWCDISDQATSWRKGDLLFRLSFYPSDPASSRGSPPAYPTYFTTCLTERFPR